MERRGEQAHREEGEMAQEEGSGRKEETGREEEGGGAAVRAAGDVPGAGRAGWVRGRVGSRGGWSPRPCGGLLPEQSTHLGHFALIVGGQK